MTHKQRHGLGMLVLSGFLSAATVHNSYAQKVFGVPGTDINYGPIQCIIDKHNNTYWVDGAGIEKKDGITGTVTHIAGTGTYGHTGNGGAATSARIDALLTLALDETNNILYLAEQSNNYIRKIDLSTGIIDDFMGTGNSGSSNDISTPTALTIDNAGNLYYGNATAVFKINISSGLKTTIGGIEHYAGYTGNGGLATSAKVWSVNDIEVDALGNVYISESGNSVIRKIDVSGYINLVAGTGTGTVANSGNGGPATSADISPRSLALDSHGTIYVASGFYIRRITSDGIITDVAGSGTSLPSNGLCSDPSSTNMLPLCLAFDTYGDLYFSDGTNAKMCKISNGLEIRDVDLNTLCAPGSSSPAVTPAFNVTVSGGAPPYTYSWSALTGNTATLSSTTSPNPSVSAVSGTKVAYFNLTVTDNTGCISTATRPVKATFNTNATFDLAMRDSYYDMLDEANSQATVDANKWEIWSSQDVWNRLSQDGLLTHQDPCSGAPCTNYMYTTIRNVGCRPSPASASLKLYWTLGGGPETWDGDWTTNLFGSTQLPQGRNIATVALSTAINPGDKMQVNSAWTPPSPHQYYGNTTSDMELCFLARVLDGHTTNTDGMTYTEGTNLSTNVNNNNNIVTHNTRVIYVSNYSPRISYLKVGNMDPTTKVFNLQFMNANSDLSTLDNYVQITVFLGPVFQKWINAGGVGTATFVDYENQAVVFDGKHAMELKNIPFNPMEQYNIQIKFEVKSGANAAFIKDNEKLLFRQVVMQGETAKPYSNFTYYLNYAGILGSPDQQEMAKVPQSEKPFFYNTGIKVYPNPASSVINFELPATGSGTLRLMDATGRMVRQQAFINQSLIQLSIDQQPAGMYFYEIISGKVPYSGKIIISK